MIRTRLARMAPARAWVAPRPALALRMQPRHSLGGMQTRVQLSTANVWRVETNPKKVTTTSTTTPITTGVHADSRSPFSPPEPKGSSQLVQELQGVAKSLDGIPQPALLVGLAGTLPYLGTAIGSLYLSWNIQKYQTFGEDSFADKLVFFTPENAEFYLPILQTIQVGYGACILSFLGAIHWGFEMSGYGGLIGIKRYIYGAAPALIAWPSILLPVDFALVAHFITFTGVWFADSAASRLGYAPGWYNQYRFLLTFIVCTSILFTLIVSGWLGDPAQASPHSNRLESLREQELRQYEKDNAKVANKAKKSSSDTKSKKQGDDQETLAEKGKQTQLQERKVAKKSQGEDVDDEED